MSGYRKRSLQRVDQNAKELIAEVQRLGAQYLPLNTVIDGVVFAHKRTFLVDWKMPKASHTAAQLKLVHAGWPIWFCSTVEDVQRMLRVEAGRA